MSQNQNALERLMKRSKPKVPSRPDVVSEGSNSDIKTQRLNEQDKSEFQTVRNTTRLEVGVNEALSNLCRQEKITKETWFEAAYLYLSERPEVMKEVIELASERIEERKEIANIRRAEAMKKKFLS